MILTFFKIHLKQLKHLLVEIGWWRSLLLIIIFAFFTPTLFIYIVQLQKIELVFFWTIIISLFLFVTHNTRKDKKFIKSIIEFPRLFFFFEYTLLLSPFILAFLLSDFYFFSFILFLLIGLITSFDWEFQGYKQPLFYVKFLPAEMFELKSGIRKNFIILCGFYLAALLLIDDIILPWLCVLVISVAFSSFYAECESKILLHLFEMSPKIFLISKLKNNLKVSILFFFPIFCFNLFYSSSYWLLIYSFFVCVFLPNYALVLKYAFFKPNIKLAAHPILVSIVVLCILIPFALPVPLLLYWKHYNNALKKLEIYLYAYN